MMAAVNLSVAAMCALWAITSEDKTFTFFPSLLCGLNLFVGLMNWRRP